MSRSTGFREATLDVAILDDPKFRALVRSTRDEAAIARCFVGYIATLTSSWAAGEPVDFLEAAPVWMTELEATAERLQSVGLLDAEGRIPAHAWASWYEPADARREALREKWRNANQRRNRSGTTAVPLRSIGGTASPDLNGTDLTRSDLNGSDLAPGAKRPGVSSRTGAPAGAPHESTFDAV